jgi:hypothetical protein
VYPGVDLGALDLGIYLLERSLAGQGGVTADEGVVHVPGDGERQFGAGVGQRRVQRLSIDHPAQQVDVVADQAMVIAVHGADVGGGTYLDLGRRDRQPVIHADQAAHPLGKRVDDATRWDVGGHDDQGAISAVFAIAAVPGDA